MKGLIFTYILTYGGAFVSLIDPYPGLLIYICFSIVRPESLWHWAVPPGNYSRIVAIALLTGWTFRGFGRWQFGRATPIVMALIGYWGWVGLSAANAPNHDIRWHFFDEMSKIVLPFLVGVTTINSIRRLKVLAWVIALSHGYVSFEMNMSWYMDGLNFIHGLGFAGMDNNSFT